MKTQKWFWLLGIAAVLGSACLARWTLGSGSESPVVVAETKSSTKHDLKGAASCSGRACHGSSEPGATDSLLHSEYTIWFLHDPHTQAYTVLKGDRSKKIMDKLNQTKGMYQEKASDEPRCLACHVTPRLAIENSSFKDKRLEDERAQGVSCEACHGPAKDWLGPHTGTDWTKKTRLEHEDYGFQELNDLPRRAEVCAGCHIGAPADPDHGIPLRDMNHDFIAAGHPRLNFEFASFLSNMPRHWEEKDREGKDRGPLAQARIWSVGQAVSLQCALELLADRAKPENKRPWPEFAELDCYTCHHDLNDSAWRQKGGVPGAIPWSSWYREMPRIIASRRNVNLEWKSRPRSAQKSISDEALALAKNQLGPWATQLDQKPLNQDEVRTLRTALLEYGQRNALDRWDTTWQTGLGLLNLNLALEHEKQPAAPLTPRWERDRDEFIQMLALPKDYGSPKMFRLQPKFDEQMRALFQKLGTE